MPKGVPFRHICAALFLGALGQFPGPVSAEDRIPADPVPTEARGPQVDWARGYAVSEIRDGVYWMTEGSHQAMFVTTGAGVVVVDAPPILGRNIAAAIASVTREPVTHVIYSHAHPDHIGAADQFPATAHYISSAATARVLQEAQRPGRTQAFGAFVGAGKVPRPTRTFRDHLRLKVGSKTFELSARRGTGHSAGDVFVFLPQQRVLMAVDYVWPGWIPFDRLGQAADVVGYRRGLYEILAYDFDTLVAGHVGRLGSRADVEATQAYVDDVIANAGAALRSVQFSEVVRRTGSDNPFLMTETYFGAVANACASTTLATWRGRLAGADIWAASHCRRAMEWLRQD